jgi:hypothetical protein
VINNNKIIIQETLIRFVSFTLRINGALFWEDDELARFKGKDCHLKTLRLLSCQRKVLVHAFGLIAKVLNNFILTSPFFWSIKERTVRRVITEQMYKKS